MELSCEYCGFEFVVEVAGDDPFSEISCPRCGAVQFADDRIASFGIDEAYPDGHAPTYCAICDDVDCADPEHH